MQKTHRVVIVGGGFAGVRLARQLATHDNLDLTLISTNSHFSYYPQFYHSATGGARSESAIPLADIVSPSRVRIVQDTVTSFDPQAHTVSSAQQTYPYDSLVLALGTVTNYFGINGLQENAFDIKTIEGAERFKHHLHRDLIDTGKPEADYVIVGAGPTGIELAAALGTYLKYMTRMHKVAKPAFKIDLIEAAPRILPRSSEAYAAKVHQRLTDLGINVMTGVSVQGETAETLTIPGRDIQTGTVVWTAGTSNNPFYKANADKFTLAKNGRVVVDEHLQSQAGVYVLGDNADTKYTGMAQTALHNADYAARDILNVAGGHGRHPYHPSAPATVIPVGERWAAAQVGPIAVYGWPGYVIRRAADLVGYVDIESFPQALKVWGIDSKHQSDCPICPSTV